MADNEIIAWDDVWRKRGFIHSIINIGRLFYTQFFIAILKKHLSSESYLIELGCGTSVALCAVSKYVHSMVGIDISAEALKISQSNVVNTNTQNIRFVRSDCRKLGIKDEIFDIVWSQGMLEHFERPEEILEEQIRICKKNGIIIIGVPAIFSFFYIWYKTSTLLNMKSLWPWTDQAFYSQRALMNTILKTRYRITKTPKVYFMQPFILGILIMEIRK